MVVNFLGESSPRLDALALVPSYCERDLCNESDPRSISPLPFPKSTQAELIAATIECINKNKTIIDLQTPIESAQLRRRFPFSRTGTTSVTRRQEDKNMLNAPPHGTNKLSVRFAGRASNT